MVALFSFYGGGDKLHAPLATLLQQKFVEGKVAKEPKSSQTAKQKFWSQLLLKRAKCLVFGSKRANLATLLGVPISRQENEMTLRYRDLSIDRIGVMAQKAEKMLLKIINE